MRIIISGGAGAMALPGIIYCLEQQDVNEIIIADKDETSIDKRIAQLNDKRLIGKVIDLMDVEGSSKLFEGAASVYNAAYLNTCLSAQKAALIAGVNYLDLGAFSPREQLKYDEGFKNKGITAVLGLGTAPGMSCIMSAYAVEKLDKVDSVEIKDVCANIVPHCEHSRALHWGYAIEGIIDEFTLPAPVMENGEIKYYPPRSLRETFIFGPPVGRSEVATTAHAEVEMFASSFMSKGLRNASWKIGFEPDFEAKIQFLCDLGFNRKEPIKVDGQMVSPKAVLLTLLNNQPPEIKKLPDFRGHMIVVVKGEEKGKKVEYTITEYATSALTEKMQKKGALSSYRTGIYGAIGTMMLARGEIVRKGVLYPEVCIPAKAFLKEAQKVGINVSVSRKVGIEEE